MTRVELKEYALVNIEEFDVFMLKHEKRCICMFANYLNKTKDYHICFLDFIALIFYLKTAKYLKFNEIELEKLTFYDTKDEWEANA